MGGVALRQKRIGKLCEREKRRQRWGGILIKFSPGVGVGFARPSLSPMAHQASTVGDLVIIPRLGQVLARRRRRELEKRNRSLYPSPIRQHVNKMLSGGGLIREPRELVDCDSLHAQPGQRQLLPLIPVQRAIAKILNENIDDDDKSHQVR